MSVSAKNMMSYGLSTEIMKYIPMIVIKFYEEGHRPLSKLQKTSELRMYFPMGTDIGASQSASPRQGVLKYPRPRGLRVILLENLYLNIGLVLIGGAGPAIVGASRHTKTIWTQKNTSYGGGQRGRIDGKPEHSKRRSTAFDGGEVQTSSHRNEQLGGDRAFDGNW
ncbi:hypothetical protein B0H13DRAFT_1857536 [Mycena leptocephala]|nr:hypothetical protein B0H13DRAFT_1857536 [Mycena leptocephala]